MKKIWIGLTAIVMVMGIGTAGAFAASSDKSDDGSSSNRSGSFEQMLPYAKQMHPDLTEERIREMYDNCHSGAVDAGKGMMNGVQDRGGMMSF